MGVNVGGVISIILFYIVILIVGLFAAWYKKRKNKKEGKHINESEELMLAGRDIGIFVGTFTMTGNTSPSLMTWEQKILH